MKIKTLNIVSAISFIAIVQLLFFWLIPTTSNTFVALYPFYTVLTTVHTAAFLLIGVKYKHPVSFAPNFSGSCVVLGEIVATILLGLLCSSIRTILFTQALITVIYVMTMAIFINIASKESVDSTHTVAPIRPYSHNNTSTVDPVTNANPPKRLPTAINND